MFDRAVSLVFSEYYDVSALDRFADAVQSQIKHPRSPLGANSTQSRVDAAIDAVLASLGASHTGRFLPGTIDYFELADIFRFAIRNDRRRLFPPDRRRHLSGHRHGRQARRRAAGSSATSMTACPPTRAGILVGDEIAAVDGKPYQEIGSFEGKVGQTVEISLRRRADARRPASRVQVEQLRPLAAFERAIIGERSDHRARRAQYRLHPAVDACRAGFDGRGRRSVGEGAAQGCRRPGVRPARALGWRRFRRRRTLRRRHAAVPADPAQRPGILANVRWHRPVVAIIDEGTRSALEVFAYALKVNGIPLVGTRTAGAVLAGRAFLLPDDSLLELAVSDAVIGDNVRLEGRGVEPDIAVPFTLPYANGKDAQLDAAVEEMRRILARG